MAPISLIKRAVPETTESETPVSAISVTDPNLLLGSLEIGIYISTVLFGVLLMQGAKYWKLRKCDNNNKKVQGLVALLIILELGHSLASMGTVYFFTVTLTGLAVKPGSCYSFSATLVFGTIIISLVQAFYVWRCYMFSNNVFLSLIGNILILVQATGTFWLTYESWVAVTSPNPFMIQTNYAWLITTVLGVKALFDVYAAGSLCWYLKRSLQEKPLDSTAKLVKRISFWTIETGLITSVASIVVLICFQLMKYNYVWVAIYLSLTKLYSISLISSLIQRRMYQKRYPAVATDSTIPKSPMRFRSKGSISTVTYTPVSTRPPSSHSSIKSSSPKRRWTDATRVYYLPRTQMPLKLAGSVIRRSTVSV
ncbi:hypothetical protein L218DRAFT_990212 [Marasmius fiardii PR-910]|nr:hypothetical protein L218DRAFT_990212 [Marasmius fiardii PR-910]